jgi:hypothetical protein
MKSFPVVDTGCTGLRALAVLGQALTDVFRLSPISPPLAALNTYVHLHIIHR